LLFLEECEVYMLNGVYGLRALRAKVRGFQAEGTSIQKRITAASGPTKASLWDMKRALGGEQRYYLLAYGLLRGLKYSQMESNARHLPDPNRLLAVMREHDRYRTVVQDGRTRVVEWTLEDVKSLLKTENESV